MESKAILNLFNEAEAILKGHFILSSGLHSDTYLQCARVCMNPDILAELCSVLAGEIKKNLKENIDLVVAPAMGGVVVGYEMARQLGVEAIFCERVDGKFQLRRGFEIKPKQNILVVEDVVTTGKSSKEAFQCIEEWNGNIVAEACLINRSSSPAPTGDIKLFSLLNLDIKTFNEDEVPNNLIDIPAIKPGSRFLKTA